jgi:cysteine desulfurase
MKVYLDNAATTAIHPEVVKAMLSVLENNFGNPSSIHGFGRESRAIIETARKNVAKYLNVSPAEIFFTSGGTEANNMALCCTIRDLGIKHAITSGTEHHAVLHTLQEQEKAGKIKLSIVNLLPDGSIDLSHLEELLKSNERSLVSLMHANNEIGNVVNLKAVGDICERYDAIFHSDTVQTMAHYTFDMQAIKAHFVTCSAHKFHGPKGIGFLYISNSVRIHPFIYGGAQERNMRGGTENIYGIVGLAKAMELAYVDLAADMAHIKALKQHMINRLTASISGVEFNGTSNQSDSLYTVLNVSLPPADFAEMLLFRLDIAGIAASGGSACSSGSNVGSHVLKAINVNPDRPSVRFSFSKFNTQAEIDYCIEQLQELYAVKEVQH